MLRKRILTALCLVAVLLLVLLSGSFPAFILLTTVFFAGAVWEVFRLFENRRPRTYAVFWTLFFAVVAFTVPRSTYFWVFVLSSVVWVLYMTPSLFFDLPDLHTVSDRVFEAMYCIGLFGAFSSVLVLYRHSSIFLFSVLAVVWLADIGAYAAGRAFGRRKLAPSISPGKTWEGVLGGWILVMIGALVSINILGTTDTLAPRLLAKMGWGGMFAALSVLVMMSVVGDLLESKLKRRIDRKDSSSLLPGHGGILDRIDSLVPILPMAVLLDTWL